MTDQSQPESSINATKQKLGVKLLRFRKVFVASILLVISLSACSGAVNDGGSKQSPDQSSPSVVQTQQPTISESPTDTWTPEVYSTKPAAQVDQVVIDKVRLNTINFSNVSDAQILEITKSVCKKLDTGVSASTILQNLQGTLGDSPSLAADFSALLGIAIGAYCPEHAKDL